MRHNRLDGHTADRLLSGHVHPDDVPQGYDALHRLLADAAVPASDGAAGATELEVATVAAMQAAVLGRPVPVTPGGSRTMRVTHLPAKIAAAAAVVVLGGGTAAAAAGSLPGPVQNTAAHVLSTVGIDVPNGSHAPNPHSNGHANGHATGTNGPDGSSGTGPDSHALPGLCNAAKHNGGHPGKSTVFSSVATSTVCSSVPAPGQSGATGDSTETSEPSDTTEPTEPSGTDEPHGTPSSTPPVSTPDDGSSGSSTGSTEGGDHATTTTTVVSGHAQTGR